MNTATTADKFDVCVKNAVLRYLIVLRCSKEGCTFAIGKHDDLSLSSSSLVGIK